jgi:osmotically-inducible protein OsmY
VTLTHPSVTLVALIAAVAACDRDKRKDVALEPPTAVGGSAGVPVVEPRPEAVAGAVRMKLERDPGIAGLDSIQVGFEAGIVELTGTTTNLLSKRRAAKLAQTVRGVLGVSNRLEVRPPKVPDWQLANNVGTALATSPTTESLRVTVEAESGVVTLQGSVGSWVEKDGAERVAESVVGVRQVDNQLAVALHAKRSDSEVERDVEARLRWDVLVDDRFIDVNVAGGVVTIAGHVASPAERDRVYTLAGLVRGALAVKADDLAIRAPTGERVRSRSKPADDEIAEAIRRAIKIDPRVDSAEIDPVVSGGMVTLRGRAESAAAKLAAEDLAHNTVGVSEVANELVVASRKPVGDAALKRRVLSMVNLDPFVTAGVVHARVDHGIVTLTGAVENNFARAHAEEAAKRLRGVVDVKNQLHVNRPEKAYVFDAYLEPYAPAVRNYVPPTSTKTDRQVEEDIHRELVWSPFVDSNQVKVRVFEGRATLTGTVETEKERRAATENAFEGGALSVDNQLAVKESVLAVPSP